MNNIVNFDIDFEHEKENLCRNLLSEIKDYNESEHSFVDYFFTGDPNESFSFAPCFYGMFLGLVCFLILVCPAGCGWLFSLCVSAAVLAVSIFISYRIYKNKFFINPQALYGRLVCITGGPEKIYEFIQDVNGNDTPELNYLLSGFLTSYNFLTEFSEIPKQNILECYIDDYKMLSFKLETPDTHMVYSYETFRYAEYENTAVDMTTIRWDGGKLQYILPYQYKYEKALE